MKLHLAPFLAVLSVPQHVHVSAFQSHPSISRRAFVYTSQMQQTQQTQLKMTLIKKRIDNYLTDVFRQSTYAADEKAGRQVYKSGKQGFDGMMEEMKDMYQDHKGDQHFITLAFAESMDLFFSKLGVAPDKYAAFCKKFPKLSAWVSKVSDNVTFSWVVGGAKIRTFEGDTKIIDKCYFRESIGEEGCIELCQKPVEQYFTERMNSPIKISPQPREQGIGCKFCYGKGCSSKELEW